jgi:hypothetical protein
MLQHSGGSNASCSSRFCCGRCDVCSVPRGRNSSVRAVRLRRQGPQHSIVIGSDRLKLWFLLWLIVRGGVIVWWGLLIGFLLGWVVLG